MMFSCPMRAAQPRLFADPQPLVERLGRDFFRQLPEAPGVYLMRDGSDAVLYVGKAKNLRKRLGSYRVANPDRMRRRLLRLLYRVQRIECEKCSDETSALARESELLLSLRPRFNRAGVWPAPRRYLVWRTTTDALEISLVETPRDGWLTHGPLRGGAVSMRTSLVRTIWCVMQPQRGMAGMPAGWFHGRLPETIRIQPTCDSRTVLHEASARLKELTSGKHDGFLEWVRNTNSLEAYSCLRTVLEEDIERVVNFFSP
jgi:predicted GIY-YIG superfamily endonuclease